MKINYTHTEIVQICDAKFLTQVNNDPIHVIYYDTRKISHGKNALFLCLKTKNRDGHDFMEEAYAKGVRTFLVDNTVPLKQFPEATIIQVVTVLGALQTLAKTHREKFNIPIIGITGSAGKTVVKEWLYHLLSDKYNVSRSPKSFNSQLGVSLSLFELNEQTEIGIIEVGISEKGEMNALEQIVQPTIGVFTAFLSAHRENFQTKEEHFLEKLALFSHCEKVFAPNILKEFDFGKVKVHFSKRIESINDRNKELIKDIAVYFKIPEEIISEKMKTLPHVAMRMETIEGMNNNTLLFDGFNLNFDGLEQALSHQMAISKLKTRIVILSKEAFSKFDSVSFETLAKRFNLIELKLELKDLIVFATKEIDNINETNNSTILFKGLHPSLKKLASSLKARKHTTHIEVSISAIKENLKTWRKRIPPVVKMMAMVKASAYGAELTQMGEILNQQNINYLGVAYVDEGVELRKSGVDLPIMVMNSEKSSWADCIEYNLEPSVYSFEQMEELVKELILLDLQNFPIHLKFDTGMHRLGFFPTDVSKVISYLQAQPELKVMSVYTHLADADNREDSSFTLEQLTKFQFISETIQKNIAYPILRHALNTEGLSNYPEYCFDMVRMGIGMFGISSNPEVEALLKPVFSWKSQISQIKTLRYGETVGYGRSFMASDETKIAIIPVGYADGFKRLLGSGVGGVYINDIYCPTVGRVCMDMVMVDITNQKFKTGDEVEIIGKNRSIVQVANLCETIPYEIMTSLSPRMPRIFVDEAD